MYAMGEFPKLVILELGATNGKTYKKV